MGWIDAGWSTDCSNRYISKGDHLCLSVMMGDPSGLEADPASVEIVFGATSVTSTVEFDTWKLDLEGARSGFPIELTFVVRCESGTQATFRARSNVVGDEPRVTTSLFGA
ncbi:MAG: hypothetical protein KC621_24770 [Myxococcales bacterium]|nr:hypothetical protein [Myxococcales bacterium]